MAPHDSFWTAAPHLCQIILMILFYVPSAALFIWGENHSNKAVIIKSLNYKISTEKRLKEDSDVAVPGLSQPSDHNLDIYTWFYCFFTSTLLLQSHSRPWHQHVSVIIHLLFTVQCVLFLLIYPSIQWGEPCWPSENQTSVYPTLVFWSHYCSTSWKTSATCLNDGLRQKVNSVLPSSLEQFILPQKKVK